MKVQEFVDKAIRLADKEETKYRGGGVGQHEGKTWLFDCGGLIKSLLWGFNFDYSQYRGGAIYKSNGVPDVDCDVFFRDYCYDKSTDFTNIEVGELVYMRGHIGIYIGDRIVVECTIDWEGKVIRTYIHTDGRRSRHNEDCLKWTHHAKCKFIEYPPKDVPRKYEAGSSVSVTGYYHKSKDGESIGEVENFIGEIMKVEKYECEYPYEIRNLGWVREKYITPYKAPIEEPKEEKPIEQPIEEPKEQELSIWQKIIQAIIDILKAILDKKD